MPFELGSTCKRNNKQTGHRSAHALIMIIVMSCTSGGFFHAWRSVWKAWRQRASTRCGCGWSRSVITAIALYRATGNMAGEPMTWSCLHAATSTPSRPTPALLGWRRPSPSRKPNWPTTKKDIRSRRTMAKWVVFFFVTMACWLPCAMRMRNLVDPCQFRAGLCQIRGKNSLQFLF